jgi:hypothetical protein
MTRYELATMKVGFGVAPKAAEAIAAYATETGAGGKLLGCWFSDIGDLNTIAVLRGFADDAELLRERDRTLRSSNPFGCGDLMASLKLESCAPFPGLPPVKPGAFGPVYEIRSYILKNGGSARPSKGGRKSSQRARRFRSSWQRCMALMAGRASRTSGPTPARTSARPCAPSRSSAALGRRRAPSG